MQCTIQWHTYTRTQWDDLLKFCPHVPLLQSYYYAQAMREGKQQSVRHGLIIINGIEAGIVQMQEVSLFGRAIHGLSIDRGPCWFKGYGKIDHLNAFATELNSQFPMRMGRKRRFMPEFFQKNTAITLNNWKKDGKKSQYKTFLLDISPELSIIRENLKKNWRNTLSKVEKSNISVEIDKDLSSLSHFLNQYIRDRIEKRYAGTSPRFLSLLAKYAAMAGECYIFNAVEDGEIIASILIFTHGRGATYQAGWTTAYGRKQSAHHLLLWQAIKLLKDNAITNFDLGGFNDDTTGLTQFKEGMGGHAIALIGSYH